ncbi:MAG TPA: hypothetical protein VGU90_02295 [Terriglobales bacterium]|nr:hypothetical protein [Terriglobales bacterium]
MLTAVIIIASWIAAYLVLQWMLRRNMARFRSELLKAQQEWTSCDRVTENSKHGGHSSDLAPETASALGQSLSALMGQPVQIRSIRRLPATHSLSNAWAREGCVLVQNSHQLHVSVNKTASANHAPQSRPASGEAASRAA